MLGNLNVTEANLCDDILILKLKGSKEPTGKILNYIGKKLANKKEAILKVDEYHPKRSLDANAYCFVLIDKLAEKLQIPKEEIYQNAIKDIGGNCETVCIQNKALKKLIEIWEKNGLGWQVDTFPSKVKGCTNAVLYYGSSVYDTKQMSRLISKIVEDCKEQGIETMTPSELSILTERWGKNGKMG